MEPFESARRLRGALRKECRMERQGTRESLVTVAAYSVLGAVALTGCGEVNPATEQRVGQPTSSATEVTDAVDTPIEARRYLFSRARAGQEGASLAVPYRDLTELLPNTSFVAPGVEPRTYAEAVVVGRITDVEPGFAFYPTSDQPDGVVTDFSDARAMWKTIHLNVAVEEQLGGDGVGETVTVRYSIDASDDFDAMKQGLLSLGTVVLPLTHVPADSYDPSMYWIGESGALLTRVIDGQLRIPALPPDEEKQMLSTADTLSELRTASEAPSRRIPAEAVGEALVRNS